MEVKGIVISKGDTVVVSDKFRKRDLIVDVSDNPSYPSPVKFEAVQDKVTMIDNIVAGQNVELFFNLNGREWTDKTGKVSYFTTLSLWKVNILEGSQQAQMTQADTSSAPEDEEMPF